MTCPMHNVNLPGLLCVETKLAVCLARSRSCSRHCSKLCRHIGVALVQAQEDYTQDLQTSLVKLRQDKDASDRALQSKHGDFQRAQDVATAALNSLSEARSRSDELQQELRSLRDSLAEANTTKVNAIQVSTAAAHACCQSKIIFVLKC